MTGTRDLAETTPEDGRYRWRRCGLLFLITTLNYVDRQMLGVLAPQLERSIGWNEVEYGNIVAAFTAAYAIGMLMAGWLVDRAGVRSAFGIAIGVWSAATMAHAAARGAIGFGAARFVLGLSEACNFPLAIRTVAEWFPKKERALATGIFNSGTTVGAIAAPLAVPWIAVTWGWQWAFLILGAVSAVWIVPWLGMYRRPEDHPRVTAAELAFIRGDAPESVARVPWAQLLPLRQTWAFTLGKFLTDPIWWFLLYWLPKFLNTRYGLTLTDLGPPLAAIYAMSMAGSVLGGDGFRRG